MINEAIFKRKPALLKGSSEGNKGSPRMRFKAMHEILTTQDDLIAAVRERQC